MIDKLKLHEIWISIDANPVIFLNDPDGHRDEKITYPLVEFLVNSILEKEKFEVGIFDDGKQKGAIIGYKEPDSQKRMEIRLKKNSSYELLLFVYDAEEKQFIYRNKLSKEEIELIPKELRDLMQKVRELDRPVSFYNP